MSRNRGLSLIELLVVITFMAVIIVMSIGIGRSTIQRASHRGAINTFLSDLAYAKQLASRENRFVAIDFADDGRRYTISRQTTIGDLSNWTQVKQSQLSEGQEFGHEFFDGASMPDFAVNSMGEVYAYPIGANPQPTQVVLTFFIKNKATGNIDYQKDVTIHAYGGVNVEK